MIYWLLLCVLVVAFLGLVVITVAFCRAYHNAQPISPEIVDLLRSKKW